MRQGHAPVSVSPTLGTHEEVFVREGGGQNSSLHATVRLDSPQCVYSQMKRDRNEVKKVKKQQQNFNYLREIRGKKKQRKKYIFAYKFEKLLYGKNKS